MWPAMIAEPISPGRGLAVYQPATDVLVGTWRVPCAVRPSLIRRRAHPDGGNHQGDRPGYPPPGTRQRRRREGPRGAGEPGQRARNIAGAAGQPGQAERAAATTSSPASSTAQASGLRTSRTAAPMAGPPSGLPGFRGFPGRCVRPRPGWAESGRMSHGISAGHAAGQPSGPAAAAQEVPNCDLMATVST